MGISTPEELKWVILERAIQAGALGTALVVAIWYAQRNGGLC